MRLSVTVLTGTLVTGSLVACSNGYGVPPTASISSDGSASKTSVAPVELRSSAILAKIHAAAGLARSDEVTPGIYACCTAGRSGKHPFGVINAYPVNDRSNGPPVCSIDGVYDPNDIAVDRQGDLLVPNYKAGTITVYAGPGLCGPKLGTIADPYGEPDDAASRNAANGEIVVANLKNSVSVCTLSGGCTAKLEARGVSVLGVALAPKGDCWGAGLTFASNSPALVYFAHCRVRGVIASGFQNPFEVRGIDIDDNGNLVVISAPSSPNSELYIYSGCKPTCSLVGGPFQLKGFVVYGHLNANSKLFVAAEAQYFGKALDVYSYSTSGIKYEYSITNGLSSGVQSAAFSPSSKE